MMHRFWCWVNAKSQAAFVKKIRREFREHMRHKPEGHEFGSVEWTNWHDRKDQLMRVLKHEVESLFFMESA